ncbi:hypothetical protein SKAU_G00407410 [Synaphobranchus kaupii]|uniref:Uncharacterized protein n=1 Tax=Synaphobranchus kaupii TaxID=118154 RepID=A0A9Q1ID06_SYNKA|nr:hypothetical protein SKAU_G00407410 [Synaphobranchus kaupii]
MASALWLYVVKNVRFTLRPRFRFPASVLEESARLLLTKWQRSAKKRNSGYSKCSNAGSSLSDGGSSPRFYI